MSAEEMMEDADLMADATEGADESDAMATDAADMAVPFDMAALDEAARLRVLEAIIFMADAPVTLEKLQQKLGAAVEVPLLLAQLQERYAGRGVELVTVAGGYAFRTALDLAPILKGEKGPELRKPPRAATETLAIVAYHQPVTRAEIEAIRGVQVSRGTLDLLMEAGWIRPGKRRETPGRPVTWLTTAQFLTHFGLSSLRDLPGVEELKAAGMLDSKPVLATLAPEAGFEESMAGLDADEGNDLLPAGDEADDYNAPAVAVVDEDTVDEAEEDFDDEEDYDDDDFDDDDDDDMGDDTADEEDASDNQGPLTAAAE